jgi:hypothetical protein
MQAHVQLRMHFTASTNRCGVLHALQVKMHISGKCSMGISFWLNLCSSACNRFQRQHSDALLSSLQDAVHAAGENARIWQVQHGHQLLAQVWLYST